MSSKFSLLPAISFSIASVPLPLVLKIEAGVAKIHVAQVQRVTTKERFIDIQKKNYYKNNSCESAVLRLAC